MVQAFSSFQPFTGQSWAKNLKVVTRRFSTPKLESQLELNDLQLPFSRPFQRLPTSINRYPNRMLLQRCTPLRFEILGHRKENWKTKELVRIVGVRFRSVPTRKAGQRLGDRIFCPRMDVVLRRGRKAPTRAVRTKPVNVSRMLKKHQKDRIISIDHSSVILDLVANYSRDGGTIVFEFCDLINGRIKNAQERTTTWFSTRKEIPIRALKSIQYSNSTPRSRNGSIEPRVGKKFKGGGIEIWGRKENRV